MVLSRRKFIQSGIVIGGAAAITDLSFTPAAWGVTGQTTPPKTTLLGTLARGAPGAGGYAPIVLQAGEPHTVRTDLGVAAKATRSKTRQPVLTFAHMTDVHLVDAQSPMRVEYSDRYEDQNSPSDPTPGLFSSAYRPQEMLTLQVVESMVRAINRAGTGPVTKVPLAFAMQTGDNSDNCQLNEVRWNIDALDGGKTVSADSGDLSKYEGVADNDSLSYDVHYWHPDSPPEGKTSDNYKSVYGFPQVQGLLGAATKPFTATGLKMPWYTAFGNHDGLVQGNFPQTLPLSLIATGSLKATSIPPGVSEADFIQTIKTADASVLAADIAVAPARVVTADARRRSVQRAETIAEHFVTTGTPVGHGFTAKNKTDGTAYYTFDNGLVRNIVLDTVNPNGYAEGSLDTAQMAWLTALLTTSKNKYVFIYSHHTSETMDNPFVATGLDPQPRVLGAAVVALLLANPNVIAWVNGHSHRNQVWARKTTSGTGGFWEINTASHVDFPQQSRLIELVDNRDGTLSIFATMVDHVGPVSYAGALGDPVSLAGLARELAANDPQDRTAAREGARTDRNVELLSPKPALV